MRIKENYKVREIAGEYIIVNQGQPDGDMTQVIALNETANRMWKAFEGKEFAEGDAAQMLMDTYGIDETLAARDAAAWIASLKNAGILAE